MTAPELRDEITRLVATVDRLPWHTRAERIDRLMPSHQRLFHGSLHHRQRALAGALDSPTPFLEALRLDLSEAL
jgi:hypothetical protein